jgi:hypothetical protein
MVHTHQGGTLALNRFSQNTLYGKKKNIDFGVMKDKEYEEMLKAIIPFAMR